MVQSIMAMVQLPGCRDRFECVSVYVNVLVSSCVFTLNILNSHTHSNDFLKPRLLHFSH